MQRWIIFYDTAENNEEKNTNNSNNEIEHKNKSNIYAYFKSKSKYINLLSTVSNAKSLYTTIEIKRADVARALQQYMGGGLSDKFLNDYLKHNIILNRNVTSADVERSTKIYVPADPLL